MSLTSQKERDDLDIFLSTIESKLRGPFSSLDLAKAVTTSALRGSLTPTEYLQRMQQVLSRTDKVIQSRMLIGLLGLEPSSSSSSSSSSGETATELNTEIFNILQQAQEAPTHEEWVRITAGLIQGIMFHDGEENSRVKSEENGGEEEEKEKGEVKKDDDGLTSRESCRGEEANKLLHKTTQEISQRISTKENDDDALYDQYKKELKAGQTDRHEDFCKYDLNPSFVPYRYSLISNNLLQPLLPEVCGTNPHFNALYDAKILAVDKQLEEQRAKEEREHQGQKEKAKLLNGTDNGSSSASSKNGGGKNGVPSGLEGVNNLPPGFRPTRLVEKATTKKSAAQASSSMFMPKKRKLPASTTTTTTAASRGGASSSSSSSAKMNPILAAKRKQLLEKGRLRQQQQQQAGTGGAGGAVGGKTAGGLLLRRKKGGAQALLSKTPMQHRLGANNSTTAAGGTAASRSGSSSASSSSSSFAQRFAAGRASKLQKLSQQGGQQRSKMKMIDDSEADSLLHKDGRGNTRRSKNSITDRLSRKRRIMATATQQGLKKNKPNATSSSLLSNASDGNKRYGMGGRGNASRTTAAAASMGGGLLNINNASDDEDDDDEEQTPTFMAQGNDDGTNNGTDNAVAGTNTNDNNNDDDEEEAMDFGFGTSNDANNDDDDDDDNNTGDKFRHTGIGFASHGDDDEDDDGDDDNEVNGANNNDDDNENNHDDNEWKSILRDRSNKLSDEDRIRVEQFFTQHYNPTPNEMIYKMKLHEERTTDPDNGQAIKETFYLELDYNTFTSKQSKKVKRY